MPCRATAKSAWQRVWTITSASQCERLNFRPRWNAENGRFRIHAIERALSRTVPSVGQNQLRDDRYSVCRHEQVLKDLRKEFQKIAGRRIGYRSLPDGATTMRSAVYVNDLKSSGEGRP